MDRVRRQLGCTDRLQWEMQSRGSGIAVAVLDTGIALHPDLRGRILSFRDFVGGMETIYDDSGHGTHVCGCIGGDGRASAGRYRGIAPQCLFCVGKVLDAQGEGSIENMYRGLEWVLRCRRQYDIRVLNISVGLGHEGSTERMQSLVELLQELWQTGVVILCAAGNRGPEAGSISPLGTGREVITVGCNEGGYFGARQDLCENYSGRGGYGMPWRKPDLVAPGTDIVSCHAGWQMYGGRIRNAYQKKSGTSMATPIVSGAAALLLQGYPDLSNEEVRRRMTYTARNLGEEWNKQGWGMLDIFRLTQMV